MAAPAQSHLPPWERDPQHQPQPQSQPHPSSPSRSRPSSLPRRQRSGALAAEREVADRANALCHEIGRTALLASLNKWTRYAEHKISHGLLALAKLDATRPAPPPGQTLDDERTRIEESVAAAACSKATFESAVHVVTAGRWRGHERQIVLDVDEARCRLINSVV